MAAQKGLNGKHIMRYRVAGFDFEFAACELKQLCPVLGNYSPFEIKASTADATDPLFKLTLDSRVTVPAAEPLETMEYDLTEDSATLRIYEDRYLLTFHWLEKGRVFTLACPVGHEDGGKHYECDYLAGGDIPPRLVLDHFMVFAMSLAALAEKALLVHASALVYNGKTVLCLGESGTGKSTHTRLWRENIAGASLLNDDGPIVRLESGRVTAYGSPWSGKTPCFKNESYPVRAFVRIRRAPFNKIERQPALKAFGALLPSCLPTLQLYDRELDRICAALSGIIAAVPVYVLDCLPDAGAVHTSFGELFL